MQPRRLDEPSRRFGDTGGFDRSHTGFGEQRARFDETRTRFDDQGYGQSPIKQIDPYAGKTTEKFDPRSLPVNYFYVSVSGVIESGTV
jgi:hypothetical protein